MEGETKHHMDERTIEQVVLTYLKRKGYKNAETAFKGEARTHPLEEMLQGQQLEIDTSIANKILFYNLSNTTCTRYRDGYSRLQAWVHSSLDLYKNELLRVLYPVFVHSFLDLVARGYAEEARQLFQQFREEHERLHLHDLQRLQGLTSPQHLEESELARTYRENKINVKLCQYAHELLMQFLLGADLMTMLSILNDHINFEVGAGQPSPAANEEEAVTLTGRPVSAMDQLNQKEIQWGALEDSLEHKLEKEVAAEVAAETDAATPSDPKKRAAEAPKGVGPKKVKKEKALGGVPEKVLFGAPRVRVKSNIPLPKMNEDEERQALDDLRKRIRVSSHALPSVCFYTFLHAHNSLNCVALSPDGSLVAGGFADSSIKIWDMASTDSGPAAATSASADATGPTPTANGGETHGTHRGKPTTRVPGGGLGYVLLQGHSGPVFAVHFSPDGRFLLSSSADCTVRLWSMELRANLVCYKGHNYPVWDVQWSPVGYYFASASHDRTARIWSMDRIQPLRILAGHLADVDCVRWHVNCNYVATGSSDRSVRLWDAQSGECMRIFAAHCGAVLALAMSPCGRFLASGDQDGAIVMWDLGSGRQVSPLMGHTGCVWTLAFSGEGSLLASGSADCSVRIWDVSASTKASRGADRPSAGGGSRRLRLIKTLPTKSTPVYALQFTRRNLLLAAGAFNPPKPPLR